MRIQSKFKDYYDYISHRFGADPDVLYIRDRVPRTVVEWSDEETLCDTIKQPYDLSTQTSRSIRFLIAGPHTLALLDTHVSGDDRRLPGDWTEPLSPAHDGLLRTDWRGRVPVRPQLPSGALLEDLIRLVGAPVFVVDSGLDRTSSGRRRLQIEDHVPILQDLGLPALVPAEQMWQGIYSTLTNVLRDSPDKAPPVTVGEKYRIEAAGFDLKTSFRHPVNPKPRRGR